MAYISPMMKILDNVTVNAGIIYLHSKLGNLEAFKEASDYYSRLLLAVLPLLLRRELLLAHEQAALMEHSPSGLSQYFLCNNP